MRPTDLPTVPGEDWDEQLQAVEDHGEARLGRVRSRTPVWRQRGSSAMLTPSAIPKSWSARNANPESRQERQEPREETKAPSELEREVEREMLIFLREQNSRLLMQVQALSKGKGSSSGTGSSNSWERVETMELGEAPPPPPSPYVSVYTPMSPSRAGEKLETEQVRYTPNGTKVPEGLPPLETATEAHVRVEWPESLGGPGAFAPVSQGQLQEVSQGVGAREMELQRGLAGTAARAKAREQEPARVGPRDHPEWSRGAHHEAPRFDDHERDRRRAYTRDILTGIGLTCTRDILMGIGLISTRDILMGIGLISTRDILTGFKLTSMRDILTGIGLTGTEETKQGNGTQGMGERERGIQSGWVQDHHHHHLSIQEISKRGEMGDLRSKTRKASHRNSRSLRERLE